MTRDGASGVASLDAVSAMEVESSRIFWMMVPADELAEDTVGLPMGLSSAWDIVTDDGNTFYKDDFRRAKACAEGQIQSADVCTFGDKRPSAMCFGFGRHVDMPK